MSCESEIHCFIIFFSKCCFWKLRLSLQKLFLHRKVYSSGVKHGYTRCLVIQILHVCVYNYLCLTFFKLRWKHRSNYTTMFIHHYKKKPLFPPESEKLSGVYTVFCNTSFTRRCLKLSTLKLKYPFDTVWCCTQ